MKPKEISLLIEKEIGGDWSITNWHIRDLEKSLIRPKKRKLRSCLVIKKLDADKRGFGR